MICEVNFKFTFHRDKISAVQLSVRAEGIPNFSANLWQHISKTRICKKGEPQKHQNDGDISQQTLTCQSLSVLW